MSEWDGDKKISGRGGGKGVGGSTMDDAMEVWLQVHRRQSCIRDS